MIRVLFRGLAVLAFAASVAPTASAQHFQPTCAAPQGPMCAVPPVPYDPTCAVPSGCSTDGNNCNSCYQPQQLNCQPQRGFFGGRPLFNWTHIQVDNREKCCQPQAQCCQPAQQTMAMPMMTMQPVQLQMTAYQPMMAAPQFVQAAPQFVQAAPQFVQAAPQFVQAAPQMMAAPQFVQAAPQIMAAPQFVQAASQMMAAPQFVQAAPQFVQAAPQAQQVTFRPQVAAAPQSAASDECNINNVCEKLAELRERVNQLAQKVDTQKDTSDIERRLTQTEAAIKQLDEQNALQTDILKEMKTMLTEKKNSEE